LLVDFQKKVSYYPHCMAKVEFGRIARARLVTDLGSNFSHHTPEERMVATDAALNVLDTIAETLGRKVVYRRLTVDIKVPNLPVALLGAGTTTPVALVSEKRAADVAWEGFQAALDLITKRRRHRERLQRAGYDEGQNQTNRLARDRFPTILGRNVRLAQYSYPDGNRGVAVVVNEKPPWRRAAQRLAKSFSVSSNRRA
jgi:hypothetical protein